MATREDLYAALDRYLEALLARDPARLEWAPGALTTENNVALEPGDGLWNTVTGIGPYDLRFADTQTSQVALFTTIEETRDTSGACIRLGLQGDKFAEVASDKLPFRVIVRNIGWLHCEASRERGSTNQTFDAVLVEAAGAGKLVAWDSP